MRPIIAQKTGIWVFFWTIYIMCLGKASIDWLGWLVNCLATKSNCINFNVIWGCAVKIVCHFDKTSNDEFSVKFWMFANFFFHSTLKSDLREVQITLIRAP